jgi:phosphoribosylamine---glycine ligase
MRVLVVGSGGREHALAWKLAASPQVERVFTAPGNAGTAELGENLQLAVSDFDGLAAAAVDRGIDLTVVGPEAPLVDGIVDHFRARGLVIAGPDHAAARIEGSKSWAKEIMNAAGVPTARAQVFTDYEKARDAALDMSLPIVVKADGLAAGKGVVVAQSHQEAVDALHSMMLDRTLGEAASEVLLEDFLSGLEVSLHVLTDGSTIYPLLPACDYKRALDHDDGPNTGGMGAYAPVPSVDPELVVEIVRTIAQPAIDAMKSRGVEYHGVLYAGLILTPDGPRVLEFNCRLGDPETQVLLPMLDGDFAALMHGAATGTLHETPPPGWRAGASVGVVLASGGYPGTYRTGRPIQGLEDLPDETLVFHAGTDRDDAGALVSSGGRVLTVVALGDTFTAAREHAYESLRRVTLPDGFYRRDIAARETLVEKAGHE